MFLKHLFSGDKKLSQKKDTSRRKLYRKITKQLGRSTKGEKLPPIQSPGKVAGILVTTFLDMNGELKASMVENKNLCEKGGFKIWRELLIAKGWLKYVPGSYSKHEMGPKLLHYINEYKSQQFELATINDVDTVRDNVKRTEQRLDRLENLAKKLIDLIDPPWDEEKENKLLSGKYNTKLKLLSSKNEEEEEEEEEENYIN